MLKIITLIVMAIAMTLLTGCETFTDVDDNVLTIVRNHCDVGSVPIMTPIPGSKDFILTCERTSNGYRF